MRGCATVHETGLIFDVKRFAVHDGNGIRTTVFFKGCSLACIWCHNPEAISRESELFEFPSRCIDCGACVQACAHGAHSIDAAGRHRFDRTRCAEEGACVASCYADALVLAGRRYGVDELMGVIEEDRGFYEASGGGVTFSGGEPYAQPGFLAEVLKRCRSAGIGTAVDTAGNVPWSAIAATIPYVDHFLFDVKHLDSRVHRAVTGARNDLILENLRRLSRTSVPIEIRIPVIPTINDDAAHIAALGRFLAGTDNITAVRLLPYLKLAGSKYRNLGRPDTMPAVDTPSQDRLESLARVLAEAERRHNGGARSRRFVADADEVSATGIAVA